MTNATKAKLMDDMEMTVPEGILNVVDLNEYIGFRLILDGDPDCENVQHIVIPKFKFDWIVENYLKAKGE